MMFVIAVFVGAVFVAGEILPSKNIGLVIDLRKNGWKFSGWQKVTAGFTGPKMMLLLQPIDVFSFLGSVNI